MFKLINELITYRFCIAYIIVIEHKVNKFINSRLIFIKFVFLKINIIITFNYSMNIWTWNLLISIVLIFFKVINIIVSKIIIFNNNTSCIFYSIKCNRILIFSKHTISSYFIYFFRLDNCLFKFIRQLNILIRNIFIFWLVKLIYPVYLRNLIKIYFFERWI